MDRKTITVLIGDFGPDRSSTHRFEATGWQIDDKHQLDLFDGGALVATFAPGWVAVHYADALAASEEQAAKPVTHRDDEFRDSPPAT